MLQDSARNSMELIFMLTGWDYAVEAPRAARSQTLERFAMHLEFHLTCMDPVMVFKKPRTFRNE